MIETKQQEVPPCPLTGWERLETKCVWCGEPLYYNKYCDKEQTILSPVPQAHGGRCREMAYDRRLLKRVVKNRRRRSGERRKRRRKSELSELDKLMQGLDQPEESDPLADLMEGVE